MNTAIPAHHTHFTLRSSIDTVPAGATGRVEHVDSYHVALTFDNYPELVFDVTDTGPEVWAAIHSVNPSMVDPPRRSRPTLAWAASILVAFVIGWAVDPPLTVANAQAAVVYVEALIFPMCAE